MFTYITPLAFVLLLTMFKEAFDDFQRYKRDKEANAEMYKVITSEGKVSRTSGELQVGDLIEIVKD